MGSRKNLPQDMLHYHGFTLIEVVVTMGLLVIVLGLLMVPVMNSLGYFRAASARADAQTAARLALDAMARELTEAMYVQLDMYDNSMIAFVPPLRVDASDPTSEIVTPPRPDWSRAVRYWRALNDPSYNYDARGLLGPGNTYFLARTEVPEPFTTGDNWNRWNDEWADSMGLTAANGAAWAPISRLVHADVARAAGDLRNRTLQPGYPYLYAQSLPAEQLTRAYRDNVVAMTPAASDYDVSGLQFNPAVISGEWLRTAERNGGRDNSIYRSQYPLWRLGAPYTGWAALSDEPYFAQLLGNLSWARDPFLLIYRYEPTSTGWAYTLSAIGAFDPRSRTMKILTAPNGMLLYDTGSYPARDTTTQFAFGVDWVDGSLRQDFPIANQQITGAALQQTVALEMYEVYDAPLLPAFNSRPAGQVLSCFLDPDSIRVRVDVGKDGTIDRTLTRVARLPRENLDECQVGLTLPDSTGLKYGYLRVPAALTRGVNPTTCDFYVDFSWRNNGIVPINPATGVVMPLSYEKPDLISAYYRSAAVIDLAVTVTRADPSANVNKRSTQTSHLTQRVKLRNLLRQVRHEE